MMNSELNNNQQQIKIVLIGDSSVGKTALFHVIEKNEFSKASSPTISGSCSIIHFLLDRNTEVPFILWDTAGQESFRSIVPMYFSRASFIFVVFDITSKISFENTRSWYKLAKDKAPEKVKIILVGNKSDLEERREVTPNEMDELKNELGAYACFETSAIKHLGVRDLMMMVARTVIDDKMLSSDDISKELEPNDSKKCC